MQATVNTWIWGLGVALASALVVMLMRRGLAKRFPFFTSLIVFYAVRAVALFAISGHVSQSVMGSMYDGLSLVDLALQIAVAAEIATRTMSRFSDWRPARGGLLLGMVVLAASAGWAAGAIWPTRGRVSLDRGQIALAAFFVLLSLWAVATGISGVLRRQVEGFTVYSVVSLISQVQRYRSALTRNTGLYRGWSYAVAVAYLLVLIYWLLAMKEKNEEREGVVIPWPQPAGDKPVGDKKVNSSTHTKRLHLVRPATRLQRSPLGNRPTATFDMDIRSPSQS